MLMITLQLSPRNNERNFMRKSLQRSKRSLLQKRSFRRNTHLFLASTTKATRSITTKYKTASRQKPSSSISTDSAVMEESLAITQISLPSTIIRQTYTPLIKSTLEDRKDLVTVLFLPFKKAYSREKHSLIIYLLNSKARSRYF